MLKVYSNKGSGNCYKVRLLLHQLGHAYEVREMDVVGGDCQRADYLRINPAGQVPCVVLEDGMVLSQSNAILMHFAHQTQYMPMDEFDESLILQWLFWEQYSHEPAIAVARFAMHYLGKTMEEDPRLPELWKKGYRALDHMEDHLKGRAFFVSERYTIADMALYAYTHVADEGGFDLSEYPRICDWLKRVESQPRFASMKEI